MTNATADQVSDAVGRAQRAFEDWSMTPAGDRAACLERAADLLEGAQSDVLALCIREAGKTIPDAVAELREAVDFLRYYATRARADFAKPLPLPGPTGERNQIQLHGRGVFACISPWNFPLAIFLGQVSAALAAGNCVVAKPAEQTCLIAMRAVELLIRAGIPKDVIAFMPVSGRLAGQLMVPDERIAGVCMTGSTETAQTIN